MKGKLVKYRFLWLAFYISLNILAGGIILNAGNLMGDMNGVRFDYPFVLVACVFIICFSYFIFLGPLFNLFTRVKTPIIGFGGNGQLTNKFGNYFNFILIILQSLFLVFNLVNNTNVAGNATVTDSLWKYFWIFVPVDVLFLISYGYFRESSFFKFSMIIFLVSTLQRGWGGAILIVLFFELYRLYSFNRLNFRRLSLVALTVVLIYPFLQFLKWSIRSGGVGDGSWNMFVSLIDTLTWNAYFDAILVGFEHIVGRIQLVSTLYQSVIHADTLQELYEGGKVLPFWLEGLHGVVYEKLIYGERSFSLATAVLGTEMFSHSDRIVGRSVTNLSYASWFFAAPLYSGLYLLYTVFILVLSVIMINANGKTRQSLNLLWFVWLIYLMPPWFGSIISFIYGLGLLVLARVIFQMFVRRKHAY